MKARQHFTKFHFDYNEDGRVISSDDYLILVHTEDHKERQGIRRPHRHIGPFVVPTRKEKV